MNAASTPKTKSILKRCSAINFSEIGESSGISESTRDISFKSETSYESWCELQSFASGKSDHRGESEYESILTLSEDFPSDQEIPDLSQEINTSPEKTKRKSVDKQGESEYESILSEDFPSDQEIPDLSQEINTSPEKTKRKSVDKQDNDVLSMDPCCEKNCISHYLTSEKLIIREDFQSLSFLNQGQQLLKDLRTFLGDPNKDVKVAQFYAFGKEVCYNGWKNLLGVSDYLLFKARRYYSEGRAFSIVRSRKSRLAKKTNIARAWMEIYFSKYGEKMPLRNQVHLASYLTKLNVHKAMKDDLVSQKDPVLGYSKFCRLWKLEFSYVKIPQRDRMSKCESCTILHEQRLNAKDKLTRSYLDNVFKIHNRLQYEQREKYYHHRSKARGQGEKYMTVIIDGMDQAKLMLPKLNKLSKAYSDAFKLKTHLTGVLDHGHCPFCVIDLFQWPHDSNLTINILLLILNRRETLPDVLYLQMDNCFRENKNQYLLTFLAILVELGIFKKVKVNFMMKGHTHDDVDQFFSRISYQKDNIVCLSELQRIIKEAFTPEPEVNMLKWMYDVRSWLEPFSEGLHNISYPHCFKLVKTTHGVKMKYKKWTKDKEWLPIDNDGIKLLKDGVTEIDLLASEPQVIPMNLECQDFVRLEKDIEKYFRGSCLFTDPIKAEWRELVDVESHYYKSDGGECWILPGLASKKTTADIQLDGESTGILAARQIEQVDHGHIPPVYTGRYDKTKQIQNTVRVVEDFEETLVVDSMVAVWLSNYKKYPVLGKILSVNEIEVKVHYWKGSWNKEWSPDFLGKVKREPWTDWLPKSCVILSGFTLVNNKLTKANKDYLKKKHQELKET